MIDLKIENTQIRINSMIIIIHILRALPCRVDKTFFLKLLLYILCRDNYSDISFRA